MAEIYANNVRGKLAQPILAVDTSITLQSGHNFLDPGSNWYRATLFRWEFTSEGIREFDHEVVKVTALAGDVLTVERELEGVALAFDPDTPIELRMTAGTAAAIESRAGQAANSAVTNHEGELDPHAQYEQKSQLKESAYREVVGGTGPLMAKTAFGIGSTGREIGSNTTINLKTLEKGIYFANRPVSDNVSGLPDYIPDADYSVHIPLTGSSPTSPINSVLTFLPIQKRIIWGLSDGTETGLLPLRVLFDDDILGAVAFDAGVPSGGLFEKGSNDFGRYRKTADGEMKCSVKYTSTHSITTGVDNIYRSSLITVPLPQTFASTLGMSLSVHLETGSGASLGVWVGRTRIVDASTVEFCLLASAAITDLNTSVSISVDGDWI